MRVIETTIKIERKYQQALQTQKNNGMFFFALIFMGVICISLG
jgi:hypothetical protein